MSDLTSMEIFLQFCRAKAEPATEFINDYILYLLDVANNFEDEKYTNYSQYLLDFMVACDEIVKYFARIITLPSEHYSQNNFVKQMENIFHFNNPDMCLFFYGIFLSNIDKILYLRNKMKSEFDQEELKHYKINIQMDLGHSNISHLNNEFKVLLRLDKNNKTSSLFEIPDTNLDAFIIKLKDIYSQIKS